MNIKQISVFLENKQGRLIAVTKCLADNGINIRALSVADTSDFGILRLIVDHPNRAYRALKSNGFTVRETDVIGIQVEDVPGGINKGLMVLEDSGINVEYVYAFLGTDPGKALNILKVDQMDKAIEVLTKAGTKLLNSEDIYKA